MNKVVPKHLENIIFFSSLFQFHTKFDFLCNFWHVGQMNAYLKQQQHLLHYPMKYANIQATCSIASGAQQAG